MKKQSYIVIGLSDFGMHIVRSLALSAVELLVIDRDEKKLEEVSDIVLNTICADAANPDVLGQLGEEYVIGMHARGVKERVILYRNVLHNALGAIITIVALQIRTLMGGQIVVETIFRWPGVGSLIMSSI